VQLSYILYRSVWFCVLGHHGFVPMSIMYIYMCVCALYIYHLIYIIFIYIYLFVCLFIYINLFICIYIHLYSLIFINIFYIYLYIFIYIYLYIFIFIYIYICFIFIYYLYLFIYTCVYVWLCVCAYMLTPCTLHGPLHSWAMLSPSLSLKLKGCWPSWSATEISQANSKWVCFKMGDTMRCFRMIQNCISGGENNYTVYQPPNLEVLPR
jgi:hypothetical protein